MNTEVKKMFPPGHMISFTTAHKMSSYLVRAKLYPPCGKVESKKIGKKRCEICKKNGTFATCIISVTGESFQSCHRFYCDSKR